MPGFLGLEGCAPLRKDRLCLGVLLLGDNGQLRSVGYDPLLRILGDAAASKKVGDLLLAIDNLSAVETVGENPADRILAPTAAALRS